MSDNLRALAEAARAVWAKSIRIWSVDDQIAMQHFEEAASPSTILALLDERDRLRTVLYSIATYLEALSDNHLRNDVDMLLDECEDPRAVAAIARQALND